MLVRHLVTIEVVLTVLGKIVQFLPCAHFASYKSLLTLRQLSLFLCLCRLSFANSGNSTLDIALASKQRIRSRQFAIEDGIADLAIELVKLVIIDLRILLGHVSNQPLIILLIIVELFQALAIFFLRQFVLLFQIFQFILTLL